LIVAHSEGFNMFQVYPFKQYFVNKSGGVRFAELLFSTPLVTLVGSGDTPSFSPRKLRLFLTSTNAQLLDLTFRTAICGVKINQKRLAVVLETSIHLYDVYSAKSLHSLATVPNPEGICALSPTDASFLAYQKEEPGKLYLFDTINLVNVAVIQAHSGSIACVTFSPDGTLLATASAKGTVIRVFRLSDRQRLFELRRGSTQTQIYDIVFSADNRFLACSSRTGTVHLWKLEPPQPEAGAGWYSYLSYYLPGTISSALEPIRSYTSVRLPPNIRTALCFTAPVGVQPTHLLIASYDGLLYPFSLVPPALQSPDTLIPSVAIDDPPPFAFSPDPLAPPFPPFPGRDGDYGAPSPVGAVDPHAPHHFPPLPPEAIDSALPLSEPHLPSHSSAYPSPLLGAPDGQPTAMPAPTPSSHDGYPPALYPPPAASAAASRPAAGFPHPAPAGPATPGGASLAAHDILPGAAAADLAPVSLRLPPGATPVMSSGRVPVPESPQYLPAPPAVSLRAPSPDAPYQPHQSVLPAPSPNPPASSTSPRVSVIPAMSLGPLPAASQSHLAPDSPAGGNQASG
jgi:hypothetical protein